MTVLGCEAGRGLRVTAPGESKPRTWCTYTWLSLAAAQEPFAPFLRVEKKTTKYTIAACAIPKKMPVFQKVHAVSGWCRLYSCTRARRFRRARRQGSDVHGAASGRHQN